MFHRIGLAIAYLVAGLYVFLVVSPALYCFQHGCRGPGEGDAFMPAFFLTPVGGIAAAFCLYHAIHNIRKGAPLSWLFWPLAIVSATVLLGVIAFIASLIYFIAFHHR